MSTATIWSFAGSVPEFLACESRLRMLNGDPARSARCDVLHGETGVTAHSAWVNGHRVSWSDREAEVALAWLELLPQCANCQARYRGVSPYCGVRCQLADKHSPTDDYEVESEAAA